MAHEKRKSLEIVAEPKSAGGKVKLTLGHDLSLYGASEGGDAILTREWNVNNIPANLFVQGDGASLDLRDKVSHLDWIEVPEFSPRDTVIVTVVSVKLTPYTPITKYIGPMPIPEPQYSANGVGVRENGDYDNGSSTKDWSVSATIPTENDLIRTQIWATPPILTAGNGLKYVLKKESSQVKLWESSQKGGIGDYNVPSTGRIFFSSDRLVTFWAEWCQRGYGTCKLSVEAIEESTGEVIIEKELSYRPFGSVTAAFVGEFQTPGNSAVSPGINNWVEERLLDGYDVHVWDDGFDMSFYGDCNKFGEGDAFDEICNAVNNRGIGVVAAVGYSHGGGSVYNLAWRMFYDGKTSNDWRYLYPPRKIRNIYSLQFTSYLDAVQNTHSGNPFAEYRRPLNSDYHTNQYQRLYITSFRGRSSNGDEDHDRSYLGVGHSEFSNHPVIRNHLTLWYKSKVRR